MELYQGLFTLLAFGVLTLCLVAAWSRRNKWFRWGFVLLSVAVLLGSYPTVTSLLSRPKPVSEEWFYKNAKKALVVGMHVVDGQALYLYLVLPGLTEPRSYKFPWNDETRKLTKELMERMEGEEGQAGVLLDYPFQPSLERERRKKGDEKFPPMEVPKAQPQAPMQFGD